MDLVGMLNDLLKEYSDVKISQLTGIERTRINRVRKGKFKIEFSELKKIIEAFAFDDDVSRKLYDAFLYEKLGRDRFNSRQMAKEFLTNLRYGENEKENYLDHPAKAEVLIDFDIKDDVRVIDSIMMVRHVIAVILLKAMADHDKVRIISSPFDNFLMSQVFSVSANAPAMEIEHIFSLASSNAIPEPQTYYMGVAKAVYPIFMLNTNYKAYYTLVGHLTNALMPYCIVTEKYTFTISSDGCSGVLSKEENLVRLHHRLFDERVKLCSTFIKKIETTESYLEHYCTIMEKTAVGFDTIGGKFYSIDYEPCVLSFINQEELQKCIENLEKSPSLLCLIDKFVNGFYDTFRKNKQISFFTKRGLRSFIETGTIDEIPSDIGLVLTPERRREVLQCVLRKMKDPNSEKVFYLLNEKEFDPPLGLRFLGAGSKADHLFIYSNRKNGVRSILSLSNPEIVAAVFDFIESLPESTMVYPREEMISYLEKTIEEM